MGSKIFWGGFQEEIVTFAMVLRDPIPPPLPLRRARMQADRMSMQIPGGDEVGIIVLVGGALMAGGMGKF